MPVQPFGLPPLEAIKILKAKGFDKRQSFDWRDMWAKDHAAAFTVAKSAGFDILDDVYKSVLKAQEGGLTYKQFVAELQPVLETKGWWGRKEVIDPKTGEKVEAQLGSARRLKTIYETNLRTAQAAGRWTQIQALRKQRPFLRYVCQMMPSSRPQHKAWHGLILPIDHPFWNEHYPPNGWGCKCDVMQLSEDDLARYNWKVSETVPDFGRVAWRNDRTGDVMTVPQGIDPAFANNAGQLGVDVHTARALGHNLETLDPRLAARATSASADFVAKALQPDLKHMYEQIAGGRHAQGRQTVVGALRLEVLDWLTAKGVEPQSGAITLGDKRLTHMLRDVKADKGTTLSRADILNLPNALANPDAILRRKSNDAILYVFKSTADPRKSTVVIELDYQLSARPADGSKKVTTKTAAIKTGTLVETRNLSLTEYDLISGSI